MYGNTSISSNNTVQRKILNCENNGDITANTSAGGICGLKTIGTVAIISNSINRGAVSATAYSGGIFGSVYDNGTGEGKLEIEYCYNVGEVKHEESIIVSGGIIGYIDGKSTVKNSYSIGLIANGTNCAGVAGSNAGTITRCYYLENSATKLYGVNSGTIDSSLNSSKTEGQLKEDDMITTLNEGASTAVWKKDENNINNGYPILSWQ